MKKNILFLINKPFTDRDYERYGINFFLLNNIKIQIWDLSKVGDSINYSNSEIITNKISINYFNSFEEVSSNFKALKDIYLIDLRVNSNSKVNLNLLRMQGAKIIRIEAGLLPSINISNWEKLKYLFKKFDISKIKKKIIYISKINNTNLTNNVYDLHICTGLSSEKKFDCKKIFSHSFDYDIYLKEKNIENRYKSDFIVFIDNGVCDHPDYSLLSIDSYAKPENYYPNMNKCFNKIERYFKKKIIICAHPRIKNTSNTSKLFDNRKVIIGKTSELIRNSFLVLSHDTTAISYVVLWKKPLIFLTSNEMIKNNYYSILSFLKVLKLKDYNIDKINKNYNFEIESKKAFNRYTFYKDNFIKHPNSKDIFSWELLLNFLNDNKQST